jgi:hypothetical protein
LKNATTYLLLIVLISGLFFVPMNAHSQQNVALAGSSAFTESVTLNDVMESAQFVHKAIRVALYNETNGTRPEYASVGLLSTNVTVARDILEGAGFDVELLTFQDILNHRLNTANFDVFVMFDNLPRENITDLVKEFWLGGGGLLSIDSAITYLSWYGIMAPESEGVSGYGSIWYYVSTSSQNITARHPVTKSYQVNDSISVSFDFGAFNRTYLEGSADSQDYSYLATAMGYPNWVTVVAKDSSTRGGKVVQMFGDQTRGVEENLLIDAVSWLCPVFRGRIVYDMSHMPRLGVDSWDTLSTYPSYYETMRNTFVNERFTFDKLYPSMEGNLTLDRLMPYDILILVSPDYNYTNAERQAVVDWVSGGGRLFVLGESPLTGPSFVVPADQINTLFQAFDMEINATSYASGTPIASKEDHPTTEGCSSLTLAYTGYINYTGDVAPIWRITGGVTIAAQAFGNGRVILSADMNFADLNHVTLTSNKQFLINVVNWLAASSARVLVYADTAGHDPNNNVYQGPVANALNDLGVPFYMTFSALGLNQSLYSQEWDLVIVDNINWIISSYFNDLLSYLQGGGRLLFNTWTYSTANADALNSYIGYEYAGPNFSPPPDIYLWAEDDPLFTNPVMYGADNISTSEDFSFGTECSNLTVFDNATALAGLSPNASKTNASIILGANGRALVNGMLLTMYWSDTDDSTYKDAEELWLNEIAFMTRPIIDSPGDMTFEGGTTGHSVMWAPKSWNPAEFTVRDAMNNVLAGGHWDGAPINFDLDDWALAAGVGTHELQLTVTDVFGFSASDAVDVTVVDTTAPTISSPADVEFQQGTTGHSIVWSCSDFYPDSYRIYINGVVNKTADWDSADISVVLDNLVQGTYNLTVVVYDTSGNSASDTVMVSVTPAGLSSTTIILIIVAGAAILVIIIVLMRRRSH